MQIVETDVRDGVGVVTLNDPGRRNALSLAMAEAVADAVRTLESAPEVGALVVTGTPPAFSAGGKASSRTGTTVESPIFGTGISSSPEKISARPWKSSQTGQRP